MKKNMCLLAVIGGFASVVYVKAANAQDDVPAPPVESKLASTPLTEGAYVAPLGQFLIPDGKIKSGGGGVLMGGYRNGSYAFEIGPTYARGGKATLLGVTVNGLAFPFVSYPGLYGTVGVGALETDGYPGLTLGKKYSTTTIDGGIGNLFRLVSGNYEYAIRAEVRYRYGVREKRLNNQMIDLDAPRNFNDVLINIGLHLPLQTMPPPPPPPVPAAVVDVAKDTDGDGVPDDRDQCPGTPTGTAVDEKGCPLAPPPPPCKAPAAGERISLAGCATGDVIVLRGVNFEFDKSKLTTNAKTILDNVGDELKAYPSIKVEVAGHTDAKGSDDYNQKLSESRAASVMAYLTDLGIAGDRLTTLGLGEAQPVADNETEEGRELNRRVELRILSGVVDASAPAAALAAAQPADAAVAPAAAAAEPEAPAAPAADASVAEPAAVATP